MALAKKILNVMRTLRTLGVDSRNEQVGYNYVSAAKLYTAVNDALSQNGIIALAESTDVKIDSKSDEILATVIVQITLIDVDDGEKLKICGVGQGIDAGDKAVAKAQTMAIKYAYKDTFLIADAEADPDANQNTKAYNRVKKYYEERGAKKSPSFIAKSISTEDVPF